MPTPLSPCTREFASAFLMLATTVAVAVGASPAWAGLIVDTTALRALQVGQSMPVDAAGSIGRGQVLVERRLLDGDALYLRFANPRFGAAWSEMIVRDARVAACVRNGVGGVESTRTRDDGSLLRERLDEASRADCAGSIVPEAGPGPHGGVA